MNQRTWVFVETRSNWLQCKGRNKNQATEVIFHRLRVFQSFIWSFPLFCQNSGKNSGEIAFFPEFFQSFSVIVV